MATADAQITSPPSRTGSTLKTGLARFHSKSDLAKARNVTPRTIDNWVARGLLPPPVKFGTTAQSRVRWTDEQVAEFDRNLAAISAGAQQTAA